MAAASDIRPGPTYLWGPLGTREEYVKIMIDNGNTVGDLVFEEFAESMRLEGEEISDQIAVPTAAAATTLRVVKKCREVTARLAGIAGEFTIQPLVVQGLTHPVNLGQHFLGRHWCSLDFATGCTQLGVRGQSVQLVGRLANQPPWAKKEVQPGEGEDLQPLARSPPQCAALPRAADPQVLGRGWELCPLGAMLMGSGEPESWTMDWAPLLEAWELPPPPEDELGAELGSLEVVEAAFAAPGPDASSLGSWADEYEWADAALATAEAQMGRGCADEDTDGAIATAAGAGEGGA